jgi:hypothetical protein
MHSASMIDLRRRSFGVRPAFVIWLDDDRAGDQGKNVALKHATSETADCAAVNERFWRPMMESAGTRWPKLPEGRKKAHDRPLARPFDATTKKQHNALQRNART